MKVKRSWINALPVGKTNVQFSFYITKIGGIDAINVTTNSAKLTAELISIIKNLPQISPATKNGLEVKIKFSHNFKIVVQ